ncbi:glycosyltransferase family 2 protein [Actinomyces howellii]|uniref:Hyaluronan synthase n=1 Tax=Actinomyces howellii TaxID=52771 RepID=A0A448HIS8_9ACTO|nr:glycosyltransferase [Actinomyces howellii]VEG29533.1 Hyaluronan synthase [Actinomyces howellii]
MPDLSVLLPARDAEATIATAVSSTLRALPADAELVVLDDGSSDATAELARAAGRDDHRLRVVTAPPSGGLTRALTSLMGMTDSRLVARMDADDVCLPWRFRTTLAAVEAGQDMVFAQVVDLLGRRPRPQAPVGIPSRTFALHLLLTNPVSHPTMLARRELVDRVGGYREVPAEDYDLWLRCAAAGARMSRVASWGLLYRVHPGQITASSSWRARSWADPDQARAFADLSERTVGRRLTRLVALEGLEPAERAAGLAEFRSAVEPVVNAVGGVEGLRLRRRLRRRIRQVESGGTQPSTRPSTDDPGAPAGEEDRP